MKDKRLVAIHALMIIPICIIIATIYGIVHDQITYSISEEYYTKFKFQQFWIPENNYNRIGAILVGIGSTWWVGLILGILISIINCIISRNRILKSSLESIGIVILIIILVEFIGFLMSYIIFNPNNTNWIIPDNVINRKNYLTVGTMHTVGYIGAIIGFVTTIILQLRNRNRKNEDYGP